MPTRKQIRGGVAVRIVQMVKNPAEGEPKGKDLYDEVASMLLEIETTGYKQALTDVAALLQHRADELTTFDEDVANTITAVLALPCTHTGERGVSRHNGESICLACGQLNPKSVAKENTNEFSNTSRALLWQT